MTDPLDRLRLPVEPLAPPRGTFDAVLARARRRRNVRTTILAALSTLVVAGTGGVVFASQESLSSGRLEVPSGRRSAAASPTPARSMPTAIPRPERSTTPGPAPLPLPHFPVLGGFRPSSVTSVGGGVTYLLGDVPCRGPAGCTSLVRTTDNGKSWVGVPAPKAALRHWQFYDNPSNTVRDLRFASVQDGWAYGGGLYATHDAARTWQRVDAGGTVVDLATDGTTTYALVGSCRTAGTACTDVRLRSTPATGDAWRDVPAVSRGTGGQIALSGTSGVIVLGEPGGASRLFVRSGSGWSLAASPGCPTGLSAAAASASSPRLFAFCGEGAAGSRLLTTYVSDDSGRTWQRQPGPALRLANGTLLTTAAATSKVVLATMLSPDFPSPVARSDDGGATWAATSLPSPPGGWRYVGARTATDLVALAPDGTIWTSRDSGVTWTAYRFP